MKNITYVNLYKGIDFNLYNFEFKEYDYNDNMDYYENCKDAILDNFKSNYEELIKSKLEEIGLRLVGFNYYSPKTYNYEGDNIDTIINVVDKDKLKKAILENKDRINKILSKNESYDGYIALTVSDVKAELNKINNLDYEPDILILTELMDIDLSSFSEDMCDIISKY